MGSTSSPTPRKMQSFHVHVYLTSLYVTAMGLLLTLFTWPLRWALSGAPILQLVILVGAAKGTRVLPFINLYPLFTTLNLLYAIASTSWLLYDIYASLCYPAIVVACLFQFNFAANIARKSLRAVLKQLHFIDDKVAFFDIPALEIDTDVDGLMVLRGITLSLSTLSFVVHGVEVGIKLSDDMELAIQTERVEVKLFRGIWVGDCFANLKGGKYEMTFGDVEGKTVDAGGDQVFVEGTPLLRAAAASSSEQIPHAETGAKMETVVKMKDHMTNGPTPDNTTPRRGLADMKQMSPDNDLASGRYFETLKFIESTSSIREAREHIRDVTDPELHEDDNALRAAICSQLHSKPSVPHPPRHSVKVTTLQNLSQPSVRRFMHRLPMLLRLLLNPVSYFHPVNISAITATASGRWIELMLVENIFKGYWSSSSDISSLKERISSWLSDANFAVEFGGITGLAQVPLVPTFSITCQLAFEDVMAYRALPKEVHLHQVVRLGGADANFVVPSFLLPHHEHLLPPIPTPDQKTEKEKDVKTAVGAPKKVQKEQELRQLEKDEANVKISAHARLPAVLSQDLLDFVAALIKATKIVEIEKTPSAMDQEVSGIKQFGKAVGEGMREGFKRTVVDGVVNDRWVARLVGKVTKKLEVARGDVGYSGDIPVALGPYRWLGEGEGEKLLP